MSAPAGSAAGQRRKLIAKVHVAKKQLGYDDELYRAVLQRVTGATSSSALAPEQLTAVLREFQRLGWQPRSAKGKRPSSNPQARLVWALWGEMTRAGLLREPSRAALRTFVLNRTGVSDPEWLTAKQAAAVIEGLKAWQRRAATKKSGVEK